MSDKEILEILCKLTDEKTNWESDIDFIATLLSNHSRKIEAKAIWLFGEMGLRYPLKAKKYVPIIAEKLDNKDSLIRERAVNALGRIGRADFNTIEPYWDKLFTRADDVEPKVRLSFIWASENIATNTPEKYVQKMGIFFKLLSDENVRVRIEAPEIFRVLGARIPELVVPYIPQLQNLVNTDIDKVVRIHAQGAIKATERAINKDKRL